LYGSRHALRQKGHWLLSPHYLIPVFDLVGGTGVYMDDVEVINKQNQTPQNKKADSYALRRSTTGGLRLVL
jgi:hypothetical protein